MTTYETLSILISLLAAVISTVSLLRTRKLAKEQLELERVTAELSRLQITSIHEEKEQKQKPKLNVALTNLGQSSYFIISNTGLGSAYNVNFQLLDCEDSPLTSDVNAKFPCPEMKPNSRIKLIAALEMGSPLTYNVQLSWEESSGKEFKDIFRVSE